MVAPQPAETKLLGGSHGGSRTPVPYTFRALRHPCWRYEPCKRRVCPRTTLATAPWPRPPASGPPYIRAGPCGASRALPEATRYWSRVTAHPPWPTGSCGSACATDPARPGCGPAHCGTIATLSGAVSPRSVPAWRDSADRGRVVFERQTRRENHKKPRAERGANGSRTPPPAAVLSGPQGTAEKDADTAILAGVPAERTPRILKAGG